MIWAHGSCQLIKFLVKQRRIRAVIFVECVIHWATDEAQTLLEEGNRVCTKFRTERRNNFAFKDVASDSSSCTKESLFRSLLVACSNTLSFTFSIWYKILFLMLAFMLVLLGTCCSCHKNTFSKRNSKRANKSFFF